MVSVCTLGAGVESQLIPEHACTRSHRIAFGVLISTSIANDNWSLTEFGTVINNDKDASKTQSV